MSSIFSGERGSSAKSFHARAQARQEGGLTKRSRRLVVGVIAVLSLGVFAASAGAYEEGGVTLPGAPLSVSVGKLGQCQSSYPNHGNNYFPGEGNVGDCGFFLAFPKAENIEKNGKNRGLASQTYGFTGSAGPDAPPLDPYIAESQSAVTGSGTATDPYSYSVTYGVDDGEQAATKYANVTDTTTYVSGEPQFTSTYTVTNTSGKTIYFRAAYAGDLYVNGDDLGTGVFLAGPPKFIGGLNTVGGVLGGFVESSEGPPWSAFQELDYPNVWTTLEETVEQPTAFNNTTEPAEVDNAAGVEWDQFREPGTGLKDKESTSFTIINRTQIPSNLKVSPLNQTLTQGQTETVSVTAQDLANQPYAGKSLHYTVAGANPQSGAVTLNSAGQAQISYVGSHPGLDTIQMYVDLVGNSVQTQGDPAAAATVTFVPIPPTPNSTYKVQSIKANADGTLTITFVPIQAGVANFVVTVPTGTIARNEGIAARRKAKKCKKNQIKLKGKCQPKITTSGKVSATGVAGVPLTLTVKPSGKVASALKKGKTVHLTATLTYKSTLGGAPTVQTFHVTVKGKKKNHKKH
jgi:hypothetical protein